VLFHRVARERKPIIGELVLGICAKGILVYEVKNNSRMLSRRFHWTEIDSLSTSVSLRLLFLWLILAVAFLLLHVVSVTCYFKLKHIHDVLCECFNPVLLFLPQRRKFTIECSPSGKKQYFVTESSKIAQYLLNLCSAQHKFHSEMTSRQLTYCLASGV